MPKVWTSDKVMSVEMSERCAKLITRIFKRCEVEDHGYKTKCWVWTGADSGTGRGGGYGRVKVDGEVSAVHRVIWACFNGYLSKNRQIDHLCRNRACCRPAHLESVTNQPRKPTA